MPMKKKGDERGVRLWKLIETYQELYGLPKAQMPEKLGMSLSTYLRRQKDPGQLTLSEIDTIMQSLKIPRAEMLNAMLIGKES